MHLGILRHSTSRAAAALTERKAHCSSLGDVRMRRLICVGSVSRVRIASVLRPRLRGIRAVCGGPQASHGTESRINRTDDPRTMLIAQGR